MRCMGEEVYLNQCCTHSKCNRTWNVALNHGVFYWAYSYNVVLPEYRRKQTNTYRIPHLNRCCLIILSHNLIPSHVSREIAEYSLSPFRYFERRGMTPRFESQLCVNHAGEVFWPTLAGKERGGWLYQGWMYEIRATAKQDNRRHVVVSIRTAWRQERRNVHSNIICMGVWRSQSQTSVDEETCTYQG